MNEFLSFRKMITPLIIQILFWIGVALCFITGLVKIVQGVGSAAGGMTVLMGVLTWILGPIFVRVYCELLILLFRIYDELVAIRTQSTGSASK